MLEIEIWKKIFLKGIETKYEISSMGRVRSRKKKKIKILKTFIDKYGYEIVGIYIKKKKKVTKFVHRLVAKAFVKNPEPDEFKEVNHIDGDKLNNCDYNLQWTNRIGNVRHAIRTGLTTFKLGEESPHHTYSNDEIRAACKMMEEGKSNKEIHKALGIKKEVIITIRSGKRWEWISKDYNLKPEGYDPYKESKTCSEKEVRKICEMVSSGYSDKEIHEILGIKKHTIAHIRRGERYVHIAKEYNIF